VDTPVAALNAWFKLSCWKDPARWGDWNALTPVADLTLSESGVV